MASGTTSMPSPTTAQSEFPNRRYAWYVVFMLMLAYAFSILDRTGLGLLVQPIEADLKISDSQMGLLQGVAFAIFYSVLGLPLGFLADRMNRRFLITAGITVWSAATMLCGSASGFAGLFAARIGVGAGEATLNPAGASMIADYFPPISRSKAFGVYAVGTSIGSGMAYLLGGAAIELAGHLRLIGPHWIAQLASWKIVFFMIGAPGLVIGLIFALTVREPKRRDRAAVADTPSLKPLLSLLSAEWRVYLGLIAGAVFNVVSIYALINWFPTLLIRIHGWTPASVGQTLGAYSVPCGIFSCLSAGWLIAWLQKRGYADAPVLIAIGSTVWVAVAGVCAALAPSANLAVVFYCILSLAINHSGVAGLTALSRITPNEMRGQAIALLTLSTGLLSLSIGPFAVGYLSVHVFGQEHGVGKSLATVLVVSGAISVGFFASARGSFRRLAQRIDRQAG